VLLASVLIKPHLTKAWSRLPIASAALPLPAAGERWRSGSSRQGCVSYEVKVLCRPLPDSDGKHIRGVGR
jgi:hypothetical protein